MNAHTVRAAIFDTAGNILMIERFKDSHHYFVLPGGHCEADETDEQALVREVREETSLNIHSERLLYEHADTFGQRESIFLCPVHDAGTVTLGPKSIESKRMLVEEQRWLPVWVKPNALEGQTVYPQGLMAALKQDRIDHFAHNPRALL